jgi:hypothetical protein
MRVPELIKRPNEMYAVGLRYTAPDLEEDESIISCTVTISPGEAGGLKKSGLAVIDENVVSQIVYDGVDGNDYYVTFVTTTSAGHVYEDSIFVKVRALL